MSSYIAIIRTLLINGETNRVSARYYSHKIRTGTDRKHPWPGRMSGFPPTNWAF
ncbi:MAG: hypothetical protein KBG16_06780 [Methanospirillum sp.]|nr:hypothetical protein [Methanospirillum sp.]